MFSFFQKKAAAKPRKSLAASIYGLEDGYIYCSLAYNSNGMRCLNAPFGRVNIQDGYTERLGMCSLEALEQSGYFDPDFDNNRPFIFAGLSKHVGFQSLDHQSVRLSITGQADGSLQVSAYDSTHRRAKLGTWPPPVHVVTERSALALGQAIVDAERPYREAMMATKWKKARQNGDMMRM